MTKPDSRSARDLTSTLARAGLFAAILGGLFAPVVRFSGIVDTSISQAGVLLLGSELFFLFLVALLNRDVRYAVDCANRDMKGGGGSDRYFRKPAISPTDPVWGVFGSRFGGGLLKIARTVLLVEFLLMLSINGKAPAHPALLLAGSAFGITLLLSMIQLRAHYPMRIEGA